MVISNMFPSPDDLPGLENFHQNLLTVWNVLSFISSKEKAKVNEALKYMYSLICLLIKRSKFTARTTVRKVEIKVCVCWKKTC